ATAEERCIIYPNVTGEQTIIRNDDVVSDLAIVPKVHADHEKISVPDHGRTVLRGPSMNRAMLSNHVTVANLDTALCGWIEPEILRSSTDEGCMADCIPATDSHRTFEHNMRLNQCPCADDDVVTYHRIRPDFDVGADRGCGI